MYRAVTLAALEADVPLDDGPALGRLASDAQIELRERDHAYVQVMLGGRDVSEQIREPAVTGASSQVAAHGEVRAAMLQKQRDLIAAGDYVVEGRDIGTVVAPDARIKVFLTAGHDDPRLRQVERFDEFRWIEPSFCATRGSISFSSSFTWCRTSEMSVDTAESKRAEPGSISSSSAMVSLTSWCSCRASSTSSSPSASRSRTAG